MSFVSPSFPSLVLRFERADFDSNRIAIHRRASKRSHPQYREDQVGRAGEGEGSAFDQCVQVSSSRARFEGKEERELTSSFASSWCCRPPRRSGTSRRRPREGLLWILLRRSASFERVSPLFRGQRKGGKEKRELTERSLPRRPWD